MTKSLIQSQIDIIEHKLKKDKEDTFNVEKFSEQTRSKIGNIFVRGFFIALFGTILFVLVYNLAIYRIIWDTALFLELDKIIPLLGSVIGTPLWFVMGYYFKNDKS